MFGSAILDVAVGLVFVFLIASLICAAIREGAESWFKTRAVYLEQGIRELLCDDKNTELAPRLYGHPLISALYKGSYDEKKIKGRRWWEPTSLPSYIPSRNFALALLDVVARGPVASSSAQPSKCISFADLNAAIATIQVESVKRLFLSALDVAHGDIAEVQGYVQKWYDSAMDRVAGWYKRRTQIYLFALGFLVAVLANINAITIARFLYRDPGRRAALVASASNLPASLGSNTGNIDTLLVRLNGIDLPVGWIGGASGSLRKTENASPERVSTPADPPVLTRILAQASIWSSVLFGWLITAFAISLGAPFWFDLLSRFMEIRSTVKPQEESSP